MKFVIFGLSVSSAWGNGHATLLRGLFRALYASGHEVHFFERDTPYYAAHRDTATLPFAHLHLYTDWSTILGSAIGELCDADVAIVTSYCADGAAACDLVLELHPPRTVFYDMDTPVTISRIERGDIVPYLPQYGLGDFDLVLSYTGGQALKKLKEQLGARCVAPLYGWVDPLIHHRVESTTDYEADLSYLGTYSPDRQGQLEDFLLRPAVSMPSGRFVVAGALYPESLNWPPNVRHFEHIPPSQHSSFYSSSRLTLSIARGTMAVLGYCPSGRLFEAAACGTPILSDWWVGLDTFFEPGEEILIAKSAEDAMAAIRADPGLLAHIGTRARERALACHTAEVRAQRLISLIKSPRDESMPYPTYSSCGEV
jgi:spore maturation protein CgeB